MSFITPYLTPAQAPLMPPAPADGASKTLPGMLISRPNGTAPDDGCGWRTRHRLAPSRQARGWGRCRFRPDEVARCDDRELGPPKCFGAQRCLENLASGVVATGREDFWKGDFEPMALSEKQSYSLGCRWVYIFNRRKAKKEIPA